MKPPAADRFLELANLVMGTLMGIFITLPIVLSSESSLSALMLLPAAGVGCLVGHRKRSSRGFLYFCLVGLMVLAILLTHNSGIATQPNPLQ